VGTIENKGNAPSWTIGLDYKLSDTTFLYLTSRRGYRGVNVNTPLFESIYTTGVAGPDLRPFQKIQEEKLTDIEIGVKSEWKIMDVPGRVDFDVFGSKYKNALQFFNIQTLVNPIAPDSPTNGSLGVNAADETISGAELNIQAQPVHGVNVSLVGAYNNATVDSLKPGPNGLLLTKGQITLPSPRWSGTASESWTLPVPVAGGDVTTSADYYQTTQFSGQYGVPLPGYQITNARVEWKGVADTGLSLAVYGRNLFNKLYFSSPSNLLPTFPTNTVYAGEQRTWGAEAKYTF
jgi:iron complex outermembrane receptor protein